VAFFCGQHRDWQLDSNGNPEELAMSLLLQLIDLGRREVDPAILQKCYDTLRPDSISSIFSAVDDVVSSMGSSAVVIIIVDGVRFFAQPRERCTAMRKVITRLIRLYRENTAGKAVLKVLLSSPTRSEFIEDLFFDEEILELPRDLPGARSHSPGRQRRLSHESR
jgi:hypothetical protein